MHLWTARVWAPSTGSSCFQFQTTTSGCAAHQLMQQQANKTCDYSHTIDQPFAACAHLRLSCMAAASCDSLPMRSRSAMSYLKKRGQPARGWRDKGVYAAPSRQASTVQVNVPVAPAGQSVLAVGNLQKSRAAAAAAHQPVMRAPPLTVMARCKWATRKQTACSTANLTALLPSHHANCNMAYQFDSHAATMHATLFCRSIAPCDSPSPTTPCLTIGAVGKMNFVCGKSGCSIGATSAHPCPLSPAIRRHGGAAAGGAVVGLSSQSSCRRKGESPAAGQPVARWG